LDKDNQVTVLPPFLQKGDTIGICAPARKVSKEDIADCIIWLKSKGFKVLESENLYSEYNQFSGNDAQRAEDFQAMMDHPEVKAVLSARGGYGCVRFIDQLDFTNFKKSPKWLIGFSDLTVMHSHVHSQLNVATLHAAMAYGLTGERRQEESAEALITLLMGKPMNYRINADPNNEEFTRIGKTTGTLIGGNLSLIYSLSGTASDIDTRGKILFIEDLDEYLYHIDRMMMQLKRSGKLSELKGLIVGGMNDMRDNTIPFGKSAVEIIAEAVEEYNYPVCFGFPSGHIPKNLPLILGGEITLEVSAKTINITSK